MRKWRRDISDGNAKEIIACLRMHGYEVTEIDRPVDAHVADGSRFGWMEIKTESRNAKYTRLQLEFMSETRSPVTIVKTEGEALIFANDFKGWTQKQKDAIAGLLVRNPNVKQFHPKMIEDALKL